AIQTKLKELKATSAELELEQKRSAVSIHAIDRDRLLFRIRRTIANLERTPPEQRRPVYANLIKFAELKPTNVRLGLYAPAGSGTSENANGTRASSARRAGSCTVSIGAEGRNRTVTTLAGPRILSPVRLPVSPPRPCPNTTKIIQGFRQVCQPL